MRRTRPSALRRGGRISIAAGGGGRSSPSSGRAPGRIAAAWTAQPIASRTSPSSSSASRRLIPLRARNERKCSRTRRARVTPPVRSTRGGDRRGFTSTSALSAIASRSPASIRSRRSPLFARWVMSVFRMTGHLPESGAGSPTASVRKAASSTERPNRSTSWRRKFPVPCAQRELSRQAGSPAARISRTAKPRLPMVTTVAGSLPWRKRKPRRSACFVGIRSRATWRPSRPVATAPETESQHQPRRRPGSRAAGSFPCSTRA